MESIVDNPLAVMLILGNILPRQSFETSIEAFAVMPSPIRVHGVLVYPGSFMTDWRPCCDGGDCAQFFCGAGDAGDGV